MIVPVRNTGSAWARLTRSASSYDVRDRAHRTVASGVFTMAMPEIVGPGQTGYLVDTLSIAFGRPGDFVSATAVVRGMPAQQPAARLSVRAIAISTGVDHGLRAAGVVANDGAVAVQSVVAGVVVLDRAGNPLSAVYDLVASPELGPGATIAFETEYPGAPPVGSEMAGTVLGYGFTTTE